MPRRPDLPGEVEVRAFEAADEAGVLEVLEAAFGRWPRDIEGVTPAEFLRWKHMDSPFGPSSLLVAEADGAIIGLVAYMRWRLRAGAQTLETMRGVDFALHPRLRRPGTSSAMAEAAVRHFPGDLAFVWGDPNARAVPVSIRSGWSEVGRLRRSVQPRAPILATLWRARARGAKAPRDVAVRAQSAAELLGDGGSVSRLLEHTSDAGGRLTTARDLDYLRWRYGHFQEYRALRTEGGEGMAIFRLRRHGSFHVLDVCELLVEGDDRRTVRRLLHLLAAAAPADLISCSFPTRRRAAMCGFVQTRHQEVLVTYPIQPKLVPDSTRSGSWALSRGDIELL